MEKISEADIRVIETIYIQRGIVEVSKVEHIRTKKFLCFKKIYVSDISSATMNQREAIFMASLTHENIANIRAAGLGGTQSAVEYFYIFSDFYEEGDLDKFIVEMRKSNWYLPEENIFEYL